MDDVQMWNLIVGFLAPILIAVVQQPRWPDGLRAFVMFLFCLVTSFVTSWLNGIQFDLENTQQLVTNFLIVMVAAISSYKGLWKPMGVAPAVEAGTSPGRHAAP